MTKDMTSGNPARLILFFAVPFLIGNLFQQFYNIADTVIVGRTLGMNALAGVGATGSFSWFALGSVQGLTSGMAALCARHFGAGDEEGLRKYFAMGIYTCILYTVILTFFCIRFTYPVLHILKTPDEIIDISYSYIIWIFIGMPAAVLFNFLSNIIRALGDSKTPLIFLIAACIINIVLDIVMIVYMKLGVAGAGIATSLAQLISGILCLIYLIKRLPILHIGRKELVFDMGIFVDILKISLPMAFLNMVVSLGSIIIQFANNTLGTLYVAANTAAAKIQLFIIQPILSFGSAISVYAAQNYGAKKYDRILKGVNQTIIMTYIWVIISTIIMILFGKVFVGAVAGPESPDELILCGYKYIVINSLCCAILTPVVIFKAVLQPLGRTVFPIVSGFIEIAGRAWSSLLLTAHFGFLGICFADPVAWTCGLSVLVADYIFMVKKFKKLETENK